MFSRFHRLKTPLLLPFVMLLAVFTSGGAAHAQKDTSPNSEAALVAETRSIQPGTPFTVAMRLRMEPHWHSYWINPGDSGLPTSISWQLPTGFKAGEIVWPHPEKISTPPLMTYGYENEVWLLTTITPPAQLPEKPVTLQAKAKWLICKDACLPASADLKLTLPVQNAPAEMDSRWTQGFAKTRAAVPTTDSNWKVRAENAATGKGFTLRLTPTAQSDATDWKAEEIYFFPAQASVIEHATPQKAIREGNEFVLSLAPSEYAEGTPKKLSGILLAPKDGSWNASGNRALAVEAPLEKAGSAAAGTVATTAPASGGNSTTTLPLALALALGGGLLLNLMPCVFPVLSLKILGFVQQSGEDKSRIKKHGFAFGAGVLLSFWVLAGVLLLLRAGGQSEAWGFQLQSPFFVAGLVILMFAVGLNLLGAFEVGVSLTRVSAPAAASHGGYAGSFWSGVLATIVATPCTAPFMGTALAFALTQPAASALAVFTFLGVGMAAPYVILSLNPALIKKLPRPGAWMETFKQLMAFPIFATALWLLTVFGLQTGVEGMSYLLGALLLLGVALWAWRRWGGDAPSTLPRNLARAGALLCTFLALGVAWNGAHLLPPEAAASTSSNGKVAWQPYSAQKVEESLAAGKPVFIDFTAAWCITCQVNKRVALAQPEVTQEFATRNVVLMRADWTRRDAEITRALEKYGRSGVPTYVLLKDREAKPQVLPEVLSQSVVLGALQEVGPRLAADSPASHVK